MDRISVTRNSKHETRNQTPRILVLGVGSPFGDDRFGWEAAEALRYSAAINTAAPGRIEILALDRPGAMLPVHWRETDIVILLDAVRSGAVPGTRHCLDARDLPGAHVSCSSHGFGVASAIGLAQALGNLPSKLLLRGVEADPAWRDSGLSPAVVTALPRFVADLAREAFGLSGSDASLAAK
jgi:hydrogenase maturation protease